MTSCFMNQLQPVGYASAAEAAAAVATPADHSGRNHGLIRGEALNGKVKDIIFEEFRYSAKQYRRFRENSCEIYALIS